MERKILHALSHRIEDPEAQIDWYDAKVGRGPAYYAYSPATPPDLLLLEDLGIAVLLEGRPQSRAALTLTLLTDEERNLRDVPKTPLQLSTPEERVAVVRAIMGLVLTPGFASSLATKVLHKKRPATIPILDNQAIFGTLLSKKWAPGREPRGSSVSNETRIGHALETIHSIVSCDQNEVVFQRLEERHPALTRIQLFDKIWWSFIRRSGA
jgi:hypothetical protein